MNAWLLIGIIYLVFMAWLARATYCAPMARQDEHGFIVLEHGHPLRDLVPVARMRRVHTSAGHESVVPTARRTTDSYATKAD